MIDPLSVSKGAYALIILLRVVYFLMTKSSKSVSMEDSPLGIFSSEPGTALYEQKNQLDRIKAELLKFGLSSNQAKVYIFLGKYGANTAPDVSKSLEIPRTETYHILNTLQ